MTIKQVQTEAERLVTDLVDSKYISRGNPIYKRIGTTEIVYLDPLSLKAANPRNYHGNISKAFDNWVNGTYFSMADPNKNTWMWIIYMGQQLAYRGDWYKRPLGTYIISSDGKVSVKRILDIAYDEKKSIHLAVQACDCFPHIKVYVQSKYNEYASLKASVADQGLNYYEIGRRCTRPMLGYNPTINKAIIAVRPDSTGYRGLQTLKNLGCTMGVFLDAGLTTNAAWDNRTIVKTGRKIGSTLYWED